MTDNRPYISMAMFFSRERESAFLKDLATYPSKFAYDQDLAISFVLLNVCMQNRFRYRLDDLLHAAPNAFGKVAKAAQQFEEQGTIIDQPNATSNV